MGSPQDEQQTYCRRREDRQDNAVTPKEQKGDGMTGKSAVSNIKIARRYQRLKGTASSMKKHT